MLSILRFAINPILSHRDMEVLPTAQIDHGRSVGNFNEKRLDSSLDDVNLFTDRLNGLNTIDFFNDERSQEARRIRAVFSGVEMITQ